MLHQVEKGTGLARCQPKRNRDITEQKRADAVSLKRSRRETHEFYGIMECKRSIFMRVQRRKISEFIEVYFCYKIPYFQKMFSSGFIEALEGKKFFPEDSPQSFDLLMVECKLYLVDPMDQIFSIILRNFRNCPSSRGPSGFSRCMSSHQWVHVFEKFMCYSMSYSVSHLRSRAHAANWLWYYNVSNYDTFFVTVLLFTGQEFPMTASSFLKSIDASVKIPRIADIKYGILVDN
ncbi:predicted protein [Sclerotinia sclerotiorum 1980 UF-70]|uniref:BTB domain-containing protein n=1 Tax=Sclerotinia sclerotiorum (strain ATCC 18683 / 1980 / Ss-1) TaxID=665079 RepID=A7EWB3_SCLS1|nr:predicted protein [Sclerotinia sclerotiorum 1980 UF-70]EDN93755.1 predicted protein [Sclerotinia sclerotiorum 1980 UF-70]